VNDAAIFAPPGSAIAEDSFVIVFVAYS
jgi:hypothetical protein